MQGVQGIEHMENLTSSFKGATEKMHSATGGTSITQRITSNYVLAPPPASRAALD